MRQSKGCTSLGLELKHGTDHKPHQYVSDVSVHLTASPLGPTPPHVQRGGKVMVATTGGSPIKPSEVALLEVDSLTALTEAAPEDWQVLKKATKAEVRALACPLTSLSQFAKAMAGIQRF